MTGDAAVKGIREHDADGSIVLVGAEQHPPYARPPLTKRPLVGCRRGEDLARHGGRRRRAAPRPAHRLARPRRAPRDRRRGRRVRWEKLLLATGGRPRTIPGTDGVVYYRTLDDYRAVRARVHEGASAVVIGGGFIGSELAASLTANGCRVTMIFPEPGIGSRRPAGRSLRLRDRVLPQARRRGADGGDGGGGGRDARSRPAPAGRSRPTSSSRGSASSPPPSWPRRPGSRSTTASSSTSSAAWRAATTSSPPATSRASPSRRSAGASASSTRTTRSRTAARSARTWPARTSPYDHLPFFYSDMFDLGYEAVGEVDSRLDDGRALAGAEPQGNRRVRRRGAAAARIPLLERLGPGRARPRADPGRRADRRGGSCLAPSRARGRRRSRRSSSASACSGRSRTSSCVVLLPLRVPPPLVAPHRARPGSRQRSSSRRAGSSLAALLVQLKTVLDNADGQLARLSGRITAFGRYLDSELDLLVNAALFAAVGWSTGRPVLAVAGFVALTTVLSVNYNAERLYRAERGDDGRARCRRRPAAPPACCAGSTSLLYAPQDRLVERFVAHRLRDAGPQARLAYHDRATRRRAREPRHVDATPSLRHLHRARPTRRVRLDRDRRAGARRSCSSCVASSPSAASRTQGGVPVTHRRRADPAPR